ncbi:YbbR-like domain-containing protein [Virgibacillus halophilus]|uniref:CdaR family protein n=1 Tax=Tigheibacillus halophilus TaxID=361280 RepID=UPI0036289204
MDKWFKSKWVVRAIALMFAVLLYVVVYTENDTTKKDYSFFGSTDETQTIDDVPLNVRIDREKYVVSGVPDTVSVTVEGSNSNVTRAVKQRNFEVYVDLTKLKGGEHNVEIESANVPDGLSVYMEPKTIDVVMEERSSKEYHVSADFVNQSQLPAGYELGNHEIKPDTVTITSSKSVIDRISLVKVFVNVAGLKDSINNREVPVKVYDSQGNELKVHMEPENVVVSAEINHPSKTVPVSVVTKGNPPEGYSLKSMKADIDKVKIYGTSSALADIDSVKTEPIDLSKVKKSGMIDTKLDLPDKVAAENGDELKVSLDLEQTKTFEGVDIDVDNLAADYDLSFIKPKDPKIDVTVSGDDETISKLKKSDIRAKIDAGGLVEGKHDMPVQITAPDGIKIKDGQEDAKVDITLPE